MLDWRKCFSFSSLGKTKFTQKNTALGGVYKLKKGEVQKKWHNKLTVSKAFLGPDKYMQYLS